MSEIVPAPWKRFGIKKLDLPDELIVRYELRIQSMVATPMI